MNETWWVNSGQLDDDQRNVLRAEPNSNLLIQGPPGSGKTNILLLRANYVRSVGPRLLFITFTRTLTEFIRSGPSIGRNDQIKSNEISTFMSWGKKFLNDMGVDFNYSKKNFAESRMDLAQSIKNYIDTNNPGKIYDSVFLDEVQDFLEIEIDILARLSHTVNAAGDSRQSIWSHREGLPAMQAYADDIVELQKHYRIGEKICEFADRIIPPKLGEPHMIDGCNYDEVARPSSVATHHCADDYSQYLICISEIKRQIRYIVDEPILVLSHSGDVRDQIWSLIENDDELADRAVLQSNQGYEAFGPDSLIRVMTIASAKGSEARAVHILKADKFETGLRELAFTAVTRAKTEVSLYHCDPLPGYLQPPSNDLPALDDIF